MFFVFGLGNPGLKYKNTRHNAGWCAVDVLAKRHGIKLKKTKFDALAGQGMIGGQKVMLAKPTTFMNNSGYAVDGMLDYYNVGLEKLIVMYDDIDIPFGSLRIRDKGSAGTHNGMRSILSYTKSGDFTRIRIGCLLYTSRIGRPIVNMGQSKALVLQSGINSIAGHSWIAAHYKSVPFHALNLLIEYSICLLYTSRCV